MLDARRMPLFLHAVNARVRFAVFLSLYHLWNLKRDETVSPARKRKRKKLSNLNFLDEFSNIMISFLYYQSD